MNKDITAYAAIDLGTSKIKLGAYIPTQSTTIEIIDSENNALITKPGGYFEMSYQELDVKLERLLSKLGKYLKDHQVTIMYFGICGQVTSLLPWNQKTDSPVNDLFSIWMDSHCDEALPVFKELTRQAPEKMGSFIPPGTNWLLTKLLYQKKHGFPDRIIWSQIGDALYYKMTGIWNSHFSSQISMVHQHQKEYVPEFLEHLEMNPSQFPILGESDPIKISDSITNKFQLPKSGFTYPALGDYYASFYALQLADNEGFLMANTSEITGVYSNSKPNLLERFVNVSFGKGYINYGSTSTGGNLIPWFFEKYLRNPVTKETLDEMTVTASKIDTDETPVFLPYINGERAPLWESRIRESFHDKHDEHTPAHIFRSVLEGVAFARKQCFEELMNPNIFRIKMTGGSTQNLLWNQIRANVLMKRLLVSNEKELAIVGIINFMMDQLGRSEPKPAIDYTLVEPDPERIKIYNIKYQRFLTYQKEQLAAL